MRKQEKPEKKRIPRRNEAIPMPRKARLQPLLKDTKAWEIVENFMKEQKELK